MHHHRHHPTEQKPNRAWHDRRIESVREKETGILMLCWRRPVAEPTACEVMRWQCAAHLHASNQEATARYTRRCPCQGVHASCWTPLLHPPASVLSDWARMPGLGFLLVGRSVGRNVRSRSILPVMFSFVVCCSVGSMIHLRLTWSRCLVKAMAYEAPANAV